MLLPGGLVDHFSLLQDGDVLPAMALAGGHETDAAVAVFVVVPRDEVGYPGSGVPQAYERTVGEAGAVLAGLKQRLRIGVVVSPSGLPDDGTTPSRCRVTSRVAPFMGEPLSECSTNSPPATPSRKWALRNSTEACSPVCPVWISQPTILRLNTSLDQVEVDKQPGHRAGQAGDVPTPQLAGPCLFEGVRICPAASRPSVFTSPFSCQLCRVQAAIATLPANPNVESAAPNVITPVTEVVSNDTNWGLQHAPAKVRADEAWVIGRGGGAKIVGKFSEQETSRTETEVESG